MREGKNFREVPRIETLNKAAQIKLLDLGGGSRVPRKVNNNLLGNYRFVAANDQTKKTRICAIKHIIAEEGFGINSLEKGKGRGVQS